MSDTLWGFRVIESDSIPAETILVGSGRTWEVWTLNQGPDRREKFMQLIRRVLRREVRPVVTVGEPSEAFLRNIGAILNAERKDL